MGDLRSMSETLPSLPTGFASLAEVTPSSLAAVGAAGVDNSLNLPAMSNMVLVLIDGLGSANLTQGYGHAPFLRAHRESTDTLRTVFPSTTAAALASLSTGLTPGQHGLTGYRVRDPKTGDVINQLNGWDDAHRHEGWFRGQTIHERGAENGFSGAVIGHARYSDSALTQMIHRGATYIPANKPADRAQAAVTAIRSGDYKGCLVYFSELDEIAHQQGPNSTAWFEKLEEVDAALRQLAEGLPPETGLLITADHGIIDIPHENHVLVCADENMAAEIAAIGGEPRCLQLYLEPTANTSGVLKTWREALEGVATVLGRDDVVAAGLYGEVAEEILPRLGDVFVFAADGYALYDARDESAAGRRMHGQHGGLSETEMLIPLVRAGAARFSVS